MTSQSNAYFANKLKERELNEVKIPEVTLKQRSLEEVDKPKVAISEAEAREHARTNLANEQLRALEAAETQRYHVADLNFKKGTTLTRNEQFEKEALGAAKDIFGKGTLSNGYGTIGWSNYSGVFNQLQNRRQAGNSKPTSVGIGGVAEESSYNGNSNSLSLTNPLVDSWNGYYKNDKFIKPIVDGINKLDEFNNEWYAGLHPDLDVDTYATTFATTETKQGNKVSGGGRRF